MPECAKSLIRNLMQISPQKRITLDKLAADSFFKQEY
jgi:hypothetical protein